MSEQKMVKQVIQTLRRGLNYQGLYEKNAPADPFELFEKWLAKAIKSEHFEPNAMSLSTAARDGTPCTRTVLLKDYSPEGFVFFTNYRSRKAQDLIENPKACLLFYWPSVSRQVRIEGPVEKVSRAVSEAYFASRPRSSQIAACASNQSEDVRDRIELKERMKKILRECKGKDVPCPAHWGGFRVKPEKIEFWQGRPDRLHDRLVYLPASENSWTFKRLAP